MQRRKSIICLILILALTFSSIPAYAVQLSSDIPDEVSVAAADTTSEFDFSDQDDLDKYDQYEKRTGEDGFEYVELAAKRSIGGVEPEPIDRARYGAFLRNSLEKQYFAFYNLKYTTNYVDQNVMTIYADPEVKFLVKNQKGIDVVNTDGIISSDDVDRFNSTLHNGHRVYYIEFVPKEVGEGIYMIEFSTNSTTTQPHYSVWFGSPLMLSKTFSLGSALFMINYPNTSSTYTFSTGNYLPVESWISKVLVTNVKRIGTDKVSRANLSVGYPGGSTSLTQSAKLETNYTFNKYPSNTTAIPARGTYKLYLDGIRWGALSSGSRFQFQGDVSVEYLYPFGA